MESAYIFRVRRVADSSAAQFYYSYFFPQTGFHKLFQIPQLRLMISQIRLFLEQFWAAQCVS